MKQYNQMDIKNSKNLKNSSPKISKTCQVCNQSFNVSPKYRYVKTCYRCHIHPPQLPKLIIDDD